MESSETPSPVKSSGGRLGFITEKVNQVRENIQKRQIEGELEKRVSFEQKRLENEGRGSDEEALKERTDQQILRMLKDEKYNSIHGELYEKLSPEMKRATPIQMETGEVVPGGGEIDRIRFTTPLDKAKYLDSTDRNISILSQTIDELQNQYRNAKNDSERNGLEVKLADYFRRLDDLQDGDTQLGKFNYKTQVLERTQSMAPVNTEVVAPQFVSDEKSDEEWKKENNTGGQDKEVIYEPQMQTLDYLQKRRAELMDKMWSEPNADMQEEIRNIDWQLESRFGVEPLYKTLGKRHQTANEISQETADEQAVVDAKLEALRKKKEENSPQGLFEKDILTANKLNTAGEIKGIEPIELGSEKTKPVEEDLGEDIESNTPGIHFTEEQKAAFEKLPDIDDVSIDVIPILKELLPLSVSMDTAMELLNRDRWCLDWSLMELAFSKDRKAEFVTSLKENMDILEWDIESVLLGPNTQEVKNYARMYKTFLLLIDGFLSKDDVTRLDPDAFQKEYNEMIVKIDSARSAIFDTLNPKPI